MKKYQNLMVILLLLTVLGFALTNSSLIFDAVLNGLSVWLYKVFPYLFVMFIISDLLLNYNIIYYLKPLFKIFNKLFNCNDYMTFVFLMSMISGFPSSAKYTKDMLDKELMSKSDAEKILGFSYFSNPLFITSILSQIFNNSKMVVIMLISMYLSNFIMGIFLRKTFSSNYDDVKTNSIKISKSLGASIENCLNTLLMVLGTIITFSIISSIFIEIINANSLIGTIIKGTLEITYGFNSIIDGNFTNIWKVIISTYFISFGGISIIVQIKNILKENNLSFKTFYLCRTFQCVLSVIINLALNNYVL